METLLVIDAENDGTTLDTLSIIHDVLEQLGVPYSQMELKNDKIIVQRAKQ